MTSAKAVIGVACLTALTGVLSSTLPAGARPDDGDVPARSEEGGDAPEAPADEGEDTESVEVTVMGDRPESHGSLSQAEVRQLPGAFGDPFRAIEALPGVTPMLSGLPYFYVRGAPPGDVGYYFAGVPVPGLYHLGVGPAVLNPAFVERVSLDAGTYPVELGRQTGGIVRGDLAQPRYESRDQFGVRLTDVSLMLEEPLADQSGSLMIGGRYGYPGLLLSLLSPELSLAYWDYQTLFTYDLGPRQRIDVLAFGAYDSLGTAEQVFEDGLPTGEEETRTVLGSTFHRVDVRWSSFDDGQQTFLAGTVGADATRGYELGKARSYLLGVRGNRSWMLETDAELRVGFDTRVDLREAVISEEQTQPLSQPTGEPIARPTNVSIFPSRSSAGELGNGADGSTASERADETEQEVRERLTGEREDYVFGVYSDVTWDITPALRFTPGIRFDVYVSGPDAALAVEPRLRLDYRVTRSLTLQNAVGIAHQLPAFVIPVPGVQPSLEGGLQRSLQHSSGFELQLPEHFVLSTSLFHHLYFNVSDPLGIARFNDTVEGSGASVLARSLGRSHGMEIMLQRSLTRDLGGILSYTLSRSTRSVGRASGPTNFDRTHVLNLAVSKDLGANWRFDTRLLFYSGVPARVAYLAATKAPSRTSPFWRLDWRLEKRWYMETRDTWWAFVIEVLNTTLQQEPIEASCHAFGCTEQLFDPITVPNLGLEAKF